MLPALGESMPEDVAQRVGYYLEQNAEALTKLDEATTIESCRFPIDLTQGIGALFPELGDIRHAAMIRRLESAWHENRGESDEALGACLKIFALSDALKDEPVLISSLVNLSIQKQAHDELKRLITKGILSDEGLVLIAPAILNNDNQRLMFRAFIGDRCTGHGLFTDLRRFDLSGDYNPAFVAMWALGVLDLDNAYYLDYMGKCADFARTQTWPIPDSVSDYESNTPRLYLISGILTPAYNACIVASTETLAQQQVLIAGVGVERYRQANGNLPEKLEDLVPAYLVEVPTDPFTGKTLKFRREEDGSIVYSVGSDEQDNGGDSGYYTWLRDAGKDGTDIAMVFGRIAERLWPEDIHNEPDDMRLDDEETLLDEDDAWYMDDLTTDEGYRAYLRELKTNGFPVLKPRNDE